MAAEISIGGYVPGALGRVTELHGTYYSRQWGFDLFFESLVARELAEFFSRFDPGRDGFWVSMAEGKIVGSVSIDGSRADSDGARLRWFIVDPEWQGRGVGRGLIDEAMRFCRRAGFRRVYLWTFAGLGAARRLYEDFGFSLCEEHEDHQWGKPVTEQRFELIL